MPIRLRLTAIFAGAMAVVLAAAGLFLHVRLRSDLRGELDAGLRSRADILLAALEEPGPSLGGGAALIEGDEAFAQVLSADGSVRESSPALREPLLGPGELAGLDGPRFLGRTVPTTEEPVEARLLAVPSEGGAVVVVGSSLDDQQEALSALTRLLGIGGPAALGLAVLAVWVLTGLAFRPVERMRAEAEAVSVEEPGRRLPVPATGDEIARLGETLNRMLGRLEQALERERRFVDDASHELRTPVSVLRGELELARSRSRTREELEAALRRAAGESEALARLTEDLLVLARLDRGRLPVRRGRVDLGALVGEALGAFAARAEERRVDLEAAVADGEADLDPLRLRQALTNLLDNALRHTPEGGRVRVAAAREGGALLVRVTDTGPGFPPEVLERPFEPFVRADAGRDRGGDGAGLGLAIVRAVVEAHGGSVELANLGGGGAEVRLRLPGA